MRLFVNGRLAGSRTSRLSLPADWITPYMGDPQNRWPDGLGRDIIRLGGHTRGWLEWDGWLDEAAYYGGTIPPAMVEDHYRLGTTGI
jgi:hypothetical protein